MRFITLLLAIIFYSQPVIATFSDDNIADIKNFRVHSGILSSSGLPDDEQFELIEKAGYLHVINLIPGDFSAEEFQITSLGISYQQIEVDWENPTVDNFNTFAYYMSTFSNLDKVYLHCKLNYRASTFAYLYQVIVKGEHQSSAKKRLLSVWQPSPHWLEYMNSVLEFYDELPSDTDND